MAEPIIEVSSVSKRYDIGRKESYGSLREEIMNTLASPFRRSREGADEGFIWALRDVSFNVEEGEVLGVIGRNGAGKSTLLKILSRITEPTEGRITMRGRVASLLEVGTGFHPELTGRENIFLNGALLGMTNAEIKAKFDEIVAFSEIEKFLDTPVKRYSSGMYVRLAFAVAAHLEPEILIIDEVLAVGDAAFQKKCLGKMGDVARGGRTVLFVSHNMAAVQKLCSRAMLFDSGRILKYDETDPVVESYLKIYSEKIGGRSDLYKLQRKHGESGNIRFSECLVINSEDKVEASLKYGEPFKVGLAAISTVDYDDLSLVVGIDSVSGVRVTTSVSDEFGVVFKAAPGKPLRAFVDFSGLTLTPGIYQLSIAIRSGRVGLDTLMNVLNFEVTSQAYGKTTPHGGTSGLIQANAQWGQNKEEYV